MTLKPKVQSRKKKINNRRKSRELVMKSVYRGLVNQIDITQIKKDIHDDPDFIRADQDLYLGESDWVDSFLYCTVQRRDPTRNSYTTLCGQDRSCDVSFLCHHSVSPADKKLVK